MSEYGSFVVIVFVVTLLIFGCPRVGGFKNVFRKEDSINLAKQKLVDKKFVVVIRTKDGKRNYWETLFIDQMMYLGAEVLYCSLECGNDFWNGSLGEIPTDTIAFVGTTWECGEGWWLDGKFLATKSWETALDKKTILAPFFSEHNDVIRLRNNLVECINRFF